MPYKDKEKRRQYQREWIACRRASYLDGEVCKHCDSEDNLELHHRDPEAKESHRIWSWSKTRLKAELKKCIVLCSACHGEAHSTAEHGTRAKYKRGCRCTACREASRLQRQKYRRSRSSIG